MKKDRSHYNKSIFMILCGVVLFGLMVWRAFWGFFGDEAAYLADLNRFLDGDRFLIDNWQPTMQLTNWVLYFLLEGIPGLSLSILDLRMIYIVYQFIVGGLGAYLLKEKRGGMAVAFIYVCFTPYNLFELSYNTFSIGMIFLFICWCVYQSDWTKFRIYIAGLFLGMSFLGIPQLLSIWVCYFLFSVIYISCKKIKKQSCKPLHGPSGVLFFSLGAGTFGTLFLCSLIGKASLSDYMYCIQQLLSDSEHSGSVGLVGTICQSIWSIIRLYWRSIVPTSLLLIVTVYNHLKLSKKGLTWKKHILLAGGSFVIAVYTTIRFAFIYGSVSVNLMIPTFMILGVELIVLLIPTKRNVVSKHISNGEYVKYVTVFIVGIMAAICDFCATNTGVMSMSAHFINCSLVAIILLFDYCHMLHKCIENGKGRFIAWIGYGTFAVYGLCVLILRMSYVFMDTNDFGQYIRVESGYLRGIYVSKERYDLYYDNMNTVELADMGIGEKAICVPNEGTSTLFLDTQIYAPFAVRFSITVDELETYYNFFPQKRPDKIIFTTWNSNRTENAIEIHDYYIENGYTELILQDGNVVLYRTPDNS